MTTMSGCKNLNIIKDLTKQFANNFSFSPSEEKKGQKCKIGHEEKILRNGVLLIVLSDKKNKRCNSFSWRRWTYEMPIVIKKDIQEFKKINNVLNLFVFKFIKHWHPIIQIQSDNDLTMQYTKVLGSLLLALTIPCFTFHLLDSSCLFVMFLLTFSWMLHK